MKPYLDDVFIHITWEYIKKDEIEIVEDARTSNFYFLPLQFREYFILHLREYIKKDMRHIFLYIFFLYYFVVFFLLFSKHMDVSNNKRNGKKDKTKKVFFLFI